MSAPEPDDTGWGEWPLEIGTPEQEARRRADRAEQKAAQDAVLAKQKEIDDAIARAHLEPSARTRKRVTEDAQKKIRRDLERERNVPESQRNLRAITALRMRRNGASNREIANALGYKSPNSVSILIGDALKDHVYDQHEVEVYRDYFLAELINQAEIAVQTIRNPGYLYDVKGDLIMGPDGQFMENISERTKAQTEWRHMQESARKLLGVDAPQRKVRKDTIIIKHVREMAEQLGIDVDGEAGMDIVDADLVALPPGEETVKPGKEPGQ